MSSLHGFVQLLEINVCIITYNLFQNLRISPLHIITSDTVLMAYTCRPLHFALGTALLHKSFIRGLPNLPRFVNEGGSDGWGEGKKRNA